MFRVGSTICFSHLTIMRHRGATIGEPLPKPFSPLPQGQPRPPYDVLLSVSPEHVPISDEIL